MCSYLPRTVEFDSHDRGAGTTNLFFYTNHPDALYRLLLRISTRPVQRKMRIAYRAVDGETFTTYWPRRDPRPFDYSYSAANNPFTPASKRVIPKRSPRGTRAK